MSWARAASTWPAVIGTARSVTSASTAGTRSGRWTAIDLMPPRLLGAAHPPAHQPVGARRGPGSPRAPSTRPGARRLVGGAVRAGSVVGPQAREQRQVVRPAEHVDAVDLQQPIRSTVRVRCRIPGSAGRGAARPCAATATRRARARERGSDRPVGSIGGDAATAPTTAATIAGGCGVGRGRRGGGGVGAVVAGSRRIVVRRRWRPSVSSRRGARGAGRGRYVRGWRDLVAVHRWTDDATRTTLVIGSMHGDEPAGTRVVRRLRFATAPDGVDPVAGADRHPDGAAAERRTNAHGVDLNATSRGTGSRLRGTANWSGPAPASEPETRAVQALCAGAAAHGAGAPPAALRGRLVQARSMTPVRRLARAWTCR